MILKGGKRYPKTIRSVAPTKHKHGADLTISFHTDTYKPTLEGHGIDFEINAIKHNLKGTILLNHQTDGMNEMAIKDAIKTGVFDGGAYFRASEDLETQITWLKNVLGKNPSYWSYANGLRDHDEFVSINGLVSRSSSVSDTSYDFNDRLGHKVSTLFNYNARDIDMQTALNNSDVALQKAIDEKGWYNDFSHWHWAEVYGDKNQFSQLMSQTENMLKDVNYIGLGASEAVEYMWLRKQFKRGGIYQDVNEIVIISENYNTENIPYSAIDTSLSVEVDLNGTVLEGKDIISNAGIINKGSNVYIVQIPYSKYDGFRTVRLKETSEPKYLILDKPVITNSQINGNTLIVTTDRPTNVVAFSTPTGTELYQASLIDRSNIMNTTHEININDITGKDIYIGAITKEKQSTLSKVNV